MREQKAKRLARMNDLQADYGGSRPWYYKQMQIADFPRPIKLGTYAVAWIRSEVDAWFASRPRAEQDGLSAIERRQMSSGVSQ